MSRRLIINADDLGYDPAVDRGILRAMREGVVTSATLIVNAPFSEAAAVAAAGLAVGLHLNLARHPPVGRSLPASLLSAGELDEARASALPPHLVRDEALAQLARAERLLGRRPTHLDVHKHLHRLPNVLEGVARAASAVALPVRSLDAQMRAALAAFRVRTTDHFVGDASDTPYWTLPRFLAEVDALPAGLTELMCHPGETPSHVRTAYGVQRVVELETLTSAAARRALSCGGVQLQSFRAV